MGPVPLPYRPAAREATFLKFTSQVETLCEVSHVRLEWGGHVNRGGKGNESWERRGVNDGTYCPNRLGCSLS